MGCDIHLFVEHRNAVDDEWRSVSEGSFNISRNYWLFGCLAKGVRSDVEYAIPPRGIPEGVDWLYTWKDIYWHVRGDSEEKEEGEDSCTEEQAKRYGRPIIKTSNGYRYTENPDRHSHSWLNLQEVKSAMSLYGANSGRQEIPTMMSGILSLMESLETRGHETRIVFSFDN